MANEHKRIRRKILMGLMIFLSPFALATFVYAMLFYDITGGMGSSKPKRSPNGRLDARVFHYWGDASDIRMETNGIHPFRLGSDDIYDYTVEDGWVSAITWRDDRTLIVSFCFHRRHPSLPERHWRDVTILFREDACGKAPL
jgi:hypothetical protein